MKIKVQFSTLCICLFYVTIGVAQQNRSYDYDILIKNGKVFDGSLTNAFKSDVAVKDGKITHLAKKINGSAAKIINAKGMHITPGFIDLHTFSSRGWPRPEDDAHAHETLLSDPVYAVWGFKAEA